MWDVPICFEVRVIVFVEQSHATPRLTLAPARSELVQHKLDRQPFTKTRRQSSSQPIPSQSKRLQTSVLPFCIRKV